MPEKKKDKMREVARLVLFTCEYEKGKPRTFNSDYPNGYHRLCRFYKDESSSLLATFEASPDDDLIKLAVAKALSNICGGSTIEVQ